VESEPELAAASEEEPPLSPESGPLEATAVKQAVPGPESEPKPEPVEPMIPYAAARDPAAPVSSVRSLIDRLFRRSG
jgi:hypothetical protein